MRKGERRRAEILRVAEDLFYTRGYESATIQDMLDVLGLSKGGFYHHFESKEQLLEALCGAKALSGARAAQEAVSACPGGPVEKLNALFEAASIWRGEHVDFVGLLLRVAYREDHLAMREKFKRRIAECTQPLLEAVIAQGMASGEFSSPYPEGVCRLVLLLSASLTDELALLLLRCGSVPPNAAQVMALLELYRHVTERLLDAPYGSVVLYPMTSMAAVCQNIWQRHIRTLYLPEVPLYGGL